MRNDPMKLRPALIPVASFGAALSAFLSVSYVLCIAGYLLFPGLPIQHSALHLSPGV